MAQQTRDWCRDSKPSQGRVACFLGMESALRFAKLAGCSSVRAERITLLPLRDRYPISSAKLATPIPRKKAKVKISGFLLLLFSLLLTNTPAFAQALPDTTLGIESSIVTPSVLIDSQLADQINGGATRGANLFHSFLQFNLDAGQRVYFASPLGIENIITRVTGANPSTILGTLGVDGSANLFLINPNGILFGPNARLDVNGSFFATTASSVVFSDGSQFSVMTPLNLPLLTVNVPLGLQFGATPGGVQVQGSNLEVPPGKTLGLVGGEVTLQGGRVAAPSGRVELGSVAGNSLLSLNPTMNNWQLGYEGVQNFQDIQLSEGAVVDASGQGGGDIQIVARSLRLDEESRVQALTLGEQPGGTLTVNASESVELTGTGTYSQDVLLFLTGQIRPANLRNGLFAMSYGSGAAGDIIINTPSLVAHNGAFVATSTLGLGAGGDLTVNASDHLELTASALITGSGNGNSGNAGDLTVNTGQLLAQENSVLGTSTLGKGEGGDLTVNASESVELIGSNPLQVLPTIRFTTGFYSSTFVAGEAGDVNVTTGRLSVRDGAAIAASTLGSGVGGDITVTASESVQLSGSSPQGMTLSSLAATAEVNSTGPGGNLTVKTGELILQDQGRLSVRSRGTGNAGELKVVADSIRLDNQGSIAAATTVTGEGGNIQLQAQSLQLRHNSIISAEGGNRGNGGDITIDTDLLVLLENSNITANALLGVGGKIDISTKGLFVDPTSNITASSTLGISGVVDINTPTDEVQVSLPILDEGFSDREQVIADSCLTRRNFERGRFAIAGSGGLPSSPYGALTDRYAVSEIQPIAGNSTAGRNDSLEESNIRKLGDSTDAPGIGVSPIQEAQGIIVTADGRVILGTTSQLIALTKTEDIICHAQEPSFNQGHPE